MVFIRPGNSALVHRFFLQALVWTVLLFPAVPRAQVNDFGLWTSVAVSHRITRNLSVTVEEQVRFDQNVSHVSQFFTDGGFEYAISKSFRAGVYYRFINSNRETYYSKRHRWYADLSYKVRLKPFQFTLRTRMQQQVEDLHSSDTGRIPSWYSRNKFSARLDLVKKYYPFVSAELYYRIASPGEERNIVDKVRYQAGINYEFNRIHSLEGYYMIQREYNVNNPVTDYIVGIGYLFAF